MELAPGDERMQPAKQECVMGNAAIHPTQQELIAVGLGRLSEEDETTVANHLDVCSECQQALSRLPPDSFVGKVRAASPVGASVLPTPPAEKVANVNSRKDGASGATSQDVPPELALQTKYRIV